MTPQEVLLRAADLVEAGWCREAYHRVGPGGVDQYCVNGALMAAAGRNLGSMSSTIGQWDAEACWKASSILTETVGAGDIVSWNDNVATSGEDVAAWMRKAAKA